MILSVHVSETVLTGLQLAFILISPKQVFTLTKAGAMMHSKSSRMPSMSCYGHSIPIDKAEVNISVLKYLEIFLIFRKFRK